MEKYSNSSAKLFARNLRSKRRAAGLTQDALGSLISYSGKSVSKWESGEAYPPAELLPEIAKLLGSDIDSFFDYKEAPKYYLGIDGDSIKCDYLLVDEGGHVLKSYQGGASNPLSLGPRLAFENLKSGISITCEGYPYGQIAVFAGVAAGNDPQNRSMILHFLEEFGFACYDCGVDAQNAISAGLHGEDGVIVIMSNGSTAISSRGGAYRIYGGYGHLIADHGSTFAYGREVLNAALSHKDGSGKPTLMTDMLEAMTGKEPRGLLTDIYDGGKKYISSFSHLLFEAYSMGDEVAREILEREMELLSRTVRAALREFDARGQRVPVVVSGTLGVYSDILLPLLEKNLRSLRYSGVKIMTERAIDGAVANARGVYEKLLNETNET